MTSRNDSYPTEEGYKGSQDDSTEIKDTDDLMRDALSLTYAEPAPPAELYEALAQLLKFFEEIASEIDTDSDSE